MSAHKEKDKNINPNARHSPKVCCLILNYNEIDAPVNCYQMLAAQDYGNLDIFVIDNGSSDYIYQNLKIHIPKDAIIRLPVNLGYTGGMNEGIKIALEQHYDYIWMLNNDAVIEDNGALRKLVAYAEGYKMDMVSPVIVDDYDQCDIKTIYGMYYDESFNQIPLYDEQSYFSCVKHERGLILLGTAILVKAAIFDDIGLLDEDFFIQYDDMEFGLRAIRKKKKVGVGVMVRIRHAFVPDYIRSAHYHYYISRNEIRIISKYCRWPVKIKQYEWTLLKIKRRIDRLQSLGLINEAQAIRMGLYDGLFGNMGAKEKVYPNYFKKASVNFLLYLLGSVRRL